MFVATAGRGIVLGAWWAIRSWDRARAQVGDRYLLQTGLAGVYADVLTATFTDDYNRYRAVQLRYPQSPPTPPVSADSSPPAAALLP